MRHSEALGLGEESLRTSIRSISNRESRSW